MKRNPLRFDTFRCKSFTQKIVRLLPLAVRPSIKTSALLAGVPARVFRGALDLFSFFLFTIFTSEQIYLVLISVFRILEEFISYESLHCINNNRTLHSYYMHTNQVANLSIIIQNAFEF